MEASCLQWRYRKVNTGIRKLSIVPLLHLSYWNRSVLQNRSILRQYAQYRPIPITVDRTLVEMWHFSCVPFSRVALLQLACWKAVFILDIPKLFHTVPKPSLAYFARELFGSEKTLKLGQQICLNSVKLCVPLHVCFTLCLPVHSLFRVPSNGRPCHAQQDMAIC